MQKPEDEKPKVEIISREEQIWTSAKEDSEAAAENARKSLIFHLELIKLSEQKLKQFKK